MFDLISVIVHLKGRWCEWIPDCPLDHRTECPKLDTATSLLLRLIPRNNSAGAPGKWERKVPFFFFFETKRNVARS